MGLSKFVIAALMLAVSLPVGAQEIVVTASRRDIANGGYFGMIAPSFPLIALKRSADYVVLNVRLAGDTRELKTRREELLATARNAIAAAGPAGIELSIGVYVLEPLTVANHGGLQFQSDGRPDTDQTRFLAKIRVTPGMDLNAARERVTRFVAGVKRVGRTELTVAGEPTLSVVRPDQYRGQIIDLIAADAAASAAKFGPTYGVDVAGLDRPVEWTRAGATDVFLYLPAAYTIRRN